MFVTEETSLYFDIANSIDEMLTTEEISEKVKEKIMAEVCTIIRHANRIDIANKELRMENKRYKQTIVNLKKAVRES